MDGKNMIKITSLGGSGEDSRNCFLVESKNGSLLLDCGVRREIAEVSKVYPGLTKDIAQNLSVVLISHAHEDHIAALPYLYELGYRGCIYASLETIELIPSYLHKWVDYVRQNNGTLPFDEENLKKLVFRSVDELPFPNQKGRDGHIIGGLWYRLELDGSSLLYTGDLTYDSLLLDADPLPKADILIIDSAYAGSVLNQEEQYGKLLRTAQRVIANGGKLLLPVPANGRGIDMFVFLCRHRLPLYAESNIIQNTAALSPQQRWVKPFDFPVSGFTAVDKTSRETALGAGISGVYLFGDGMMTSPASRQYFEAVKSDPRSCIIISGHTAKGTLGNSLLNADFRQQNGIRASAERLTIKVHNDEDDVLKIAEKVCPKYMMLFHAPKDHCEKLTETLNARGITTVCGTGQALTVR